MSKRKSFEEDMARLEDLVAKLEQGELGLDESMKAFEEGVKLAESLSKSLRAAQAKIRKLSKTEQGELVLSELENGTEDEPVDDVD